MKISVRMVRMWIVSALCSCSTCLWQLWEGISGFANSYLLCRIPWCSAKLGDLPWLNWPLKTKNQSNHWAMGVWQVFLQSLGMLIFHKKTWSIQYSDVLRQFLGGFVIPVKASEYWNWGHFIAILCWIWCAAAMSSFCCFYISFCTDILADGKEMSFHVAGDVCSSSQLLLNLMSNFF